MARKSRNFVFVIGAGASKEFGLPTGKELLQQISTLAYYREFEKSKFVFESPIANDIGRLAAKIEGPSATHPSIEHRRLALQDKAVWLSQIALLAPSIDNVLHSHRDDAEIVLLGKLMIAHCLILAEQKSLIANRVHPDGKQSIFFLARRDRGTDIYVADTWLGELFRILVELRSLSEFLEQLSKITFISFNYDRCVKQFIGWCARIYFKLDANQTQVVLDATNVIHPYGSLGTLAVSDDEVCGYGADFADLLETASKIKTFTESIDEESISKKLHASFSEASDVFFLGFGFLDLNMQLLFGKNRYEIENIYGTSLGYSESSAKFIRRSIEKKLLWGSKKPESVNLYETDGESGRIKLESTSCTQLLRIHHFLLRA